VAGETIQPPPAGPPFLLDTHIWLWHVGGSERLPVALRAHEIDLGHRDPADHLIAATALVYGLTLMTVDARLVAAPWLPTRSA